jgi:hypothetical protein
VALAIPSGTHPRPLSASQRGVAYKMEALLSLIYEYDMVLQHDHELFFILMQQIIFLHVFIPELSSKI